MSASPPVEHPAWVAALEQELMVLLQDTGVSALRCSTTGDFALVRRGRVEKLDVRLGATCVEALRAALLDAEGDECVTHLAHARYRLGRLSRDHLTVFVQKVPPMAVTLQDLLDEQLVEATQIEPVLRGLYAGEGLLVVGRDGYARDRVVTAFANACLAHHDVIDVQSGRGYGATRFPELTGSLAERALHAHAWGARFGVAFGLTPDDLEAWGKARPPLALICSCDAPSISQLKAQLQPLMLESVVTQWGSVFIDDAGYLSFRVTPTTQDMLAQRTLNGPHAGASPMSLTRDGAASTDARMSTLTPDGAITGFAGAVDERELLHGLPPLEPLAPGPPSAWASSAPGDDPGWELSDLAADETGASLGSSTLVSRASQDELGRPVQGEGPRRQGGACQDASRFDRVLASVQQRPTYSPQRPQAHPQALQLQGDPLGGMTLEPPRSAPRADVDGPPATAEEDTAE